MSLPIIIIFERHWDEIPKLLVKDLLPNLATKGYDTLCVEASQDFDSNKVVASYNFNLKEITQLHDQAVKLLKQVNITKKITEMSFSSLCELLRLYVASTHYIEIAEKIKELPGARILKKIFEKAKKLSWSIKGVDINASEYYQITSADLSKRIKMIDAFEERRMNTIFDNLLKLKKRKDGLIFICGAAHANNLLAKFKKENIERDVLFYFPHSSDRYDDSIDDIAQVALNGVLQDHTHLVTKGEIKSFSKRILQEIVSKKYQKEISDENSLSQVFNTYFIPESYASALLSVNETIGKNITAIGV